MAEVKIKIPPEEIESFCKRYNVRRMSLFGSILRDDFMPESDVDVLVQFDADARVSFMTLGKMQRELAVIFQRPVDLVPQDGLKPVIRNQVLSTAQEVYTSDNLADRIEKGDWFLREVVETGKVVYERIDA